MSTPSISCSSSIGICVCRAGPPHEDGDDDDVPEADEEERKNIFSIRSTLGVCSISYGRKFGGIKVCGLGSRF